MNPKSPKLELTPEDFAKVQQMRKRAEDSKAANKLEPEWAFIAEFGHYYGWGGVASILNDEITFEVARQLMRGARRIRYEKVIDDAVAMQTATIAAGSKKGKIIMQKGLAHFLKEANNG